LLEVEKKVDAYEEVRKKYKDEYTDLEGVGNVFKRRYSGWHIEQQSKEELQNDIAIHREVFGK
jgi:hypothetical protein